MYCVDNVGPLQSTVHEDMFVPCFRIIGTDKML